MISKKKLIIIVSICAIVSLLCYYQPAYAGQATSALKVSDKKSTSVKKAKPAKKVKAAQITKPVPKQTSIQKDWMITGYGVKLSPDTLGETITFNAKYEDSYVAVLALAKRIYSFKKAPIDIELEGQVGKHFGEQNHLEVNLAPVFRWKSFPWDKYVDTSCAVGAGLSYAFEKPDIEEDSVSNHSSPKLLGYLMLEFAFSLPDRPQWSFVTRVHHRSGANGIFDGRLDASNGIGCGIKYSF